MTKHKEFMMKSCSIPTLKRLPGYLRFLKELQKAKVGSVTSAKLGMALQVDSISVRKDLEVVNAAGSPGVGYQTLELIHCIETFLGWNNSSEAFLIGLNPLGVALLEYQGFAEYGLKIVAGFNLESAFGGSSINQIPIFDLSKLETLAGRLQIKLAILCVPEARAQQIGEQLAAAGIRAIWNFTAHTLHLPAGVIQQRADLAGDLAVLSVKLGEMLKSEEDVT